MTLTFASVDGSFAAAVQKTAYARTPDEQASEGAALAEYLLSDAPLGPGEREMLAWLVTGQLAHPRGAKPKTAGNSRVIEVVERYRALLNKPMQEKAAASLTAKELGVSISTVRAYRRLLEERELAGRLRK